MKTRTLVLNIVWTLSAMVLLVGAATVKADDSVETRISTSSAAQGIKRGVVGEGRVSHDELAPLVTKGDRSSSTRASRQKAMATVNSEAGAGTVTRTPNVEFWFYDADVELYADLDRDGYFSGIDLAFDVDTVYNVADVYAVIYLSYEFGPWNEYAVTEDFTIYGSSADDQYIIETDLVAGYMTGDYDILIELFDIYDGSFVADIGPDQSSELSFLPLEDIGRDTPLETTIVVNSNSSGGGAFGWLGLLTLVVFSALRQRSKFLA